MSQITGRLDSGPFTFQSAVATNADGNAMDVRKYINLNVQVVGTAGFDGVVNFEGTVDGTNYAAITGSRTSDLTPGATTTGANLNEIWWFANVSALQYFRCRTSTTTAASVTVIGMGKP